MLPISKEVLNFVRSCEAIPGRLAHGDPLTPEEQAEAGLASSFHPGHSSRFSHACGRPLHGGTGWMSPQAFPSPSGVLLTLQRSP